MIVQSFIAFNGVLHTEYRLMCNLLETYDDTGLIDDIAVSVSYER